jgi:hypothetical protein
LLPFWQHFGNIWQQKVLEKVAYAILQQKSIKKVAKVLLLKIY